jgi:phosphatidylethanolamine/phosphatidyl-N-methylethanolamine N-methyltransferase
MDYHRIYNRLADTYDMAIGPILRHGQKMAVHAMDLKPGMKILEVGIGTGLTLPFYPRDTEIKGIDLSEGMLKKAEKRIKDLHMGNVELFVMSAEEMTFKDASFDCVFAPSVFSVVNYPARVLEEMYRVCKKDGVICIISHFSGDTPFQKIYDRFWDPFTRKLIGFRMTTPRNVVEGYTATEVILKRPIYSPLNFNTLYLLKKKN